MSCGHYSANVLEAQFCLALPREDPVRSFFFFFKFIYFYFIGVLPVCMFV